MNVDVATIWLIIVALALIVLLFWVRTLSQSSSIWALVVVVVTVLALRGSA